MAIEITRDGHIAPIATLTPNELVELSNRIAATGLTSLVSRARDWAAARRRGSGGARPSAAGQEP